MPNCDFLTVLQLPNMTVNRVGAHELAVLPHFSDNHLQENSSLADFSPSYSLQSSQENGFCRVQSLQKVDGYFDLQDRHASSGLGKHDDVKENVDKVSILSGDASSMKIGGPTWLRNAITMQGCGSSLVESHEGGSVCVQSGPSHLQTPQSRNRTTLALNAQWLSIPITMGNEVQPARSKMDFLREGIPNDSVIALSREQPHGSADPFSPSPKRTGLLTGLQSDGCTSNELVEPDAEQKIRQTSQLKADIVTHPLYEQLLAAHVTCLRVTTPADRIHEIDEQLDQSENIAAKYTALSQSHLADERNELDQFMTNYVVLLCSFKEQLQHFRTQARDAMMACRELQQDFVDLTGISLGEGTGATMSDEDLQDLDNDPYILCDTDLDGQDSGGLGPLMPTETERSLMERVRHELKAELKQEYKEKISDVRDEILRKRRAGKLPGDTTSVLKSWWHAHSKWPYPTEDEKVRLVQETGLQLKQINNWFINQRKRNWNLNASSVSALNPKRKR